jgi:hypothetical protein
MHFGLIEAVDLISGRQKGERIEESVRVVVLKRTVEK